MQLHVSCNRVPPARKITSFVQHIGILGENRPRKVLRASLSCCSRLFTPTICSKMGRLRASCFA